MRKLICFLILIVLFAKQSFAMVVFSQQKSAKEIGVPSTGLADFEPFGSFEGYKYQTIFKPLLDAATEQANLVFEFVSIRSSKRNIPSKDDDKVTVFVGCLPETHDYRNLEFVYPSLLSTPISIITLPSAKIAKKSELINLKGGYYINEHYPDFVKSQITQAFKAKAYNSYLEMFEALFNKEIDYAFSNYYYGTIKIAEHGLSNELSFSKQSIWSIPVFVCLNKLGPDYSLVRDYFAKISKDPQTKEAVKQYLIKTINDVKTKYQGVSPPAFVKGDM